jgi:hypothetical protein
MYISPGDLKRTLYAGLSKKTARLVLATLIALILLGMLGGETPALKRPSSDSGFSDVETYRRVADRLREGGEYYETAGTELRARGYATRPFLNWRLPTLAVFLSILPSTDWGKYLLTVLACIAQVLWFITWRRNYGIGLALVGTVILFGISIACLMDSFLFHELWSGVLILLSLGAFANRLRWLCLVAGVLALFIRELSLPFVFVMLLAAKKEARNREVLLWFVGLGSFFVYLLVHAWIVSSLFLEGDLVSSWVRLGLWDFVLATARRIAFLIALPKWIAGLIFPLALLGLIGWKGPVADRAKGTTLLYVSAFLLVGRPDNDYWGLMYTPLAYIGLLYSPASLRDLWAAGDLPGGSTRKGNQVESDLESS